MWSYRLVAPYTFERIDICRSKTPESLGDGQVLLRFLAAGICGSDLPGFRGAKGRLPGDTRHAVPRRWTASRSTRSSAK